MDFEIGYKGGKNTPKKPSSDGKINCLLNKITLANRQMTSDSSFISQLFCLSLCSFYFLVLPNAAAVSIFETRAKKDGF